MAQSSTLLSTVLLLAVFNPDNFVTSMSSLDHSSIEQGDINLYTEERNMSKRSNVPITCLDKVEKNNETVLCSNIQNYPDTTHLQQLLQEKFSDVDKKYGEDYLTPAKTSRYPEENLCRTRVRLIYPQSGMDKDYNWLIIVNIPNYKQGIRIEECIDQNEECGKQTGISVPNRFRAVCQQDYVYRKLISYKNDDVVTEEFKVPSCCKCVLKSK